MAGNKEKMTRETTLQYKIATGYHVPEVNNPDWSEYTTIVDAVFGVGLARPIEGHYAKIIHEMNSARAKKDRCRHPVRSERRYWPGNGNCLQCRSYCYICLM